MGTEPPGSAQARVQAVAFAAVVLKDDPEPVWDGREAMVEVRNEDGGVVDVVGRAVDGPAA